jgi:thiol-disulfide isomerase/thioredoxin
MTSWRAAAAATAVVLAACGGGSERPRYEANDLVTGADVSLDDLRGSPALLVSWTTWCAECDEELAGLAEFARSADAEGLEIVAVNLDAGDVEDEITAKLERHDLSTGLWRDRSNQFRGAFGALGVPTTVLLDADGDVRGTFPGAADFDDAEILAAIEEIRDP